MAYTVYRYVNKINGKCYVGITSRTIKQRWHHGTGYDHCLRFAAAIRKYGQDAFRNDVIAIGLTKEQAEELERRLIRFWNTTDENCGYNIEFGGNAAGKHSPETRRKISESQKGKKLSEEHRRKLSKSHKGQVQTPEAREKARIRMMGNTYGVGVHPSDETRRKMSESHRATENKKRRRVRCSDGKEYRCAREAGEAYGFTSGQVRCNCLGITKTLTGSNLTFTFIE